MLKIKKSRVDRIYSGRFQSLRQIKDSGARSA
jgi:hypothetical protein